MSCLIHSMLVLLGMRGEAQGITVHCGLGPKLVQILVEQ